jgi:hypothetical protein
MEDPNGNCLGHRGHAASKSFSDLGSFSMAWLGQLQLTSNIGGHKRGERTRKESEGCLAIVLRPRLWVFCDGIFDASDGRAIHANHLPSSVIGLSVLLPPPPDEVGVSHLDALVLRQRCVSSKDRDVPKR